MPGDLERRGQDGDCLDVPLGQSLQRTSVLAWWEGEVGVGVRPEVVGLRQLVDEQEGGTPGDGSRGGLWQTYQNLKQSTTLTFRQLSAVQFYCPTAERH